MKLGDIIKAYRAEHHLSMQEFAEMADMSKGYISRLEHGKNPRNGKPIIPSYKTVYKIAHVIGISVDDMMQSMDGDQLIQLEPSSRSTIPVYGSVPAGVPLEAVEDIKGYEDVPSEWVGKYIALSVQADMIPVKIKLYNFQWFADFLLLTRY